MTNDIEIRGPGGGRVLKCVEFYRIDSANDDALNDELLSHVRNCKHQWCVQFWKGLQS